MRASCGSRVGGRDGLGGSAAIPLPSRCPKAAFSVRLPSQRASTVTCDKSQKLREFSGYPGRESNLCSRPYQGRVDAFRPAH
jgi:hypothetical protein